MNPADGPAAEGKPEDIAGMVAWLASPEGQFANGAGFTVDGGANA
jgi:3-oxoacyl-[acyl-carrier protein] reductase